VGGDHPAGAGSGQRAVYLWSLAMAWLLGGSGVPSRSVSSPERDHMERTDTCARPVIITGNSKSS
jgi:hypothetical protein